MAWNHIGLKNHDILTVEYLKSHGKKEYNIKKEREVSMRRKRETGKKKYKYLQQLLIKHGKFERNLIADGQMAFWFW